MTHRGRVWAHGLVIILGLAAMVAGFVSGRTYAGIAGLLTALALRPRAVTPLRRSGPPIRGLCAD